MKLLLALYAMAVLCGCAATYTPKNPNFGPITISISPTAGDYKSIRSLIER